MGLLQGVRVLDLSRVLAGPWASQLLADLGAEVIKIERPGAGDDTRAWGPPWWDEAAGLSAYFLSANRGKRSLAVDIAQAEGAALVRDLAARSQILIENFKVGALQRFGLDWEALRAVNPALVYCSITGYGQSGPNAQRAGYDAAIQAEAGLMSLTGEPASQGGAPQKVGVAVVDLMTGMYAVAGVLAALRHAERTGEGQHIDLALFDTQVAALANQASNYRVSGEVPARHGTAHPNIVPYQVMPSADGWFMLAVGNDAQFRRLCQRLDRPDWADEPSFASNAQRVANRETLIALLRERLLCQPSAYWIEVLSNEGVPCGPVNDLAEVFDSAQVEARGLRLDLLDANGQAVPLVANPLRFSATPISYARVPPELGVDTCDVLQSVLGLSEAQSHALRRKGVVG